MRPIVITIAAAAMLNGAGCTTTKEHFAQARVQHTPLAFDPTEATDLAGWWTNDERMLRLDEAGSYALYDGTNRYRPPTERGDWSQRTYAEVRLFAYDSIRRDWTRVAVSRIDGEIALTLPASEPMFAIAAPPPVPEDALLGPWSSGEGTLLFDAGAGYAFSRILPPRPGPGPPIVAGHRGGWRLEGDRLLLTPHPPNLGPFELRVATDAGTTILRGPVATYRRPAPATLGPPPTVSGASDPAGE